MCEGTDGVGRTGAGRWGDCVLVSMAGAVRHPPVTLSRTVTASLTAATSTADTRRQSERDVDGGAEHACSPCDPGCRAQAAPGEGGEDTDCLNAGARTVECGDEKEGLWCEERTK